MTHIYSLLDQSGTPFYVGKTGNLRKRVGYHVGEAGRGKRRWVYNKIRKLIREGFTPEIEVIETVEDGLADERERHHIARLRADGVRLCNLTDGGEGGCTSESARKGIQTKLERYGTLKRSAETRRKVSEAMKGRVFSDEHRAALSKSWKRTPEQLKRMGENISRSTRGKINIKRYICTSPSGEVFVTQNGLSGFCREHGLSQQGMSAVARGQRKHHKGWTAREAE